MPVSWSAQRKKKSPEDYEKERVGKYAKYFQGNKVPEFVEAVEPKNLSFVVTDLRTRRLAGIKKDTLKIC